MNYRELAEKTESYIVENRRYLHAHPELSEKEVETTDYLVKKLEEMGLKPNRFDGFYGCWADIEGAQPGKTVCLRADIDALPINEETGLDFAATNGCMHACGHDTHMSMLLGAAKMLCETKDSLKGKVRILFQPAEETGFGAPAVIRSGLLKDVDAIYGAHIWGNFDAPYISIESGNRMSSAGKFVVEVEGVSAHGSAPNLGVDAIVCAASMIMNLQTYVSRNNDPLNPIVLTVGTIQGGNRWNVIAGKCSFDGTVRTFSPDTLTALPEAMQRICEGTAAAYGAKVKVNVKWLTVPVINDHEDLNTIAQNAVKKLYGEEALGHLETMMGGEDFSFFMQEVPGVFGFIGSRDVEKGYVYSNHQEQYTVDEALLKRGAAVYAQFAHDYLEQN